MMEKFYYALFAILAIIYFFGIIIDDNKIMDAIRPAIIVQALLTAMMIILFKPLIARFF